jgi:hypothetical protein
MDRILFLRGEISKSAEALPEGDTLKKTVKEFDGKIDNVRKKIVATTEGGAITGEERIREHTDQLYGALLSFEGKPGDYHLAYIDALRKELDDVSKDFEQLLAKDLPPVNDALKAKGQPAVAPPPAKVAVDESAIQSSVAGNTSGDPDTSIGKIALPAIFRLLH